VGGLKGTVQTLQLSPLWRKKCPWATAPQFPYLVGRQPTTLENVVTDEDAIRLYLLSTTYFGERSCSRSRSSRSTTATGCHGWYTSWRPSASAIPYR